MRIQILQRVAVPVLGQVYDLVQIEILFLRIGKDPAGIIDPGNRGRKHVKWVARQINNAGIWEEFKRAGISIPAPQRLVYVENADALPALRQPPKARKKPKS